MNIAAIIPAKGYSRRIPAKNTRKFCGIPLFAWSVIQAKTAAYVDRVYVSTDTDEIARIAERYGAIPLFRQGNAQRTDATGSVPIRDAIGQISKQWPLDLVVDLLPTAVLRKPGEIDSVILLYYHTPDAHEALTLAANEECAMYERTDEKYYKVLFGDKTNATLTQGNSIGVHHKDDYVAMTSGLPLTDKEIDAAGVIIEPVEWVSCYVEIEWWQRFDIDYPDEFDLCEWLMERRILKGRGAEVYYEYDRYAGAKRNGFGRVLKATSASRRGKNTMTRRVK